MTGEISDADLERALSLERFARYVAWANQDRARAIELYTLNTRISESLYIPLQALEIALRNRIHAVMTEARHESWFSDDGFLLDAKQPEQLAKAGGSMIAILPGKPRRKAADCEQEKNCPSNELWSFQP
jgi:hypothetical protein